MPRCKIKVFICLAVIATIAMSTRAQDAVEEILGDLRFQVVPDGVLMGSAKDGGVTLILSGKQYTDKDVLAATRRGGLSAVLLENTSISAEGLRQIAACRNLRGLSVVDMPLGDDALKACSDASWFGFLNLHNVGVTDAGLAHLRKLTNLQAIRLSKNPIQGRGLDNLRLLSKLTRLDLDGTKLTDDGLQRIRSLRNLEDIDLKGTRITDEGVRDLACFANLQSLNLSGTKVTSCGVRCLQNLSQLSRLSLNDTNINDKTLDYLQKLDRLEDLLVHHTKITAAGAERFYQAVRNRRLAIDRGKKIPLTNRTAKQQRLALPVLSFFVGDDFDYEHNEWEQSTSF